MTNDTVAVDQAPLALGMPRSDALWVPVHLITVDELHQGIQQIIAAGRRELVLNVNINCMNLAYSRPWMRKLLREAAVVFCDGAGVALALRVWGGVRVPVRITYADWMWQLASFCVENEYSLYFLGGRPGVAQKAADKLREAAPRLNVVGCHHGYFDREGPENDEVIAAISRAKPNILVMGFGMPLQEEWLAKHHRSVAANVFLAGGAVFDFLSGETPRGPRWLVDHGFEWLVRLVVEPRRLWRRYVVGNPVFLWRAWRWVRRHPPTRPAGASR